MIIIEYIAVSYSHNYTGYISYLYRLHRSLLQISQRHSNTWQLRLSQPRPKDLDVRTEVALPSAKAFVTRALKVEPLYVWYDYFSCPQLEHISSHGDVAPVDSGGMSNLAKAGKIPRRDVMM